MRTYIPGFASRSARSLLVLFIAVLAAWGAPVRSARPSRPALSADAAVRRLLADQQSAWNRGDVEEFLAGYWNSERTVFAGSAGVTRGWQAVRARYRKSYPDRKAMGTLTFSNLEVTVLCPDAALAIGQWHLDREAGAIGGVFSLVLRQFPDGWRIIADHTSVVLAGSPPGTP